MADTEETAAELLTNQPGPSPGNAPDAKRNEPSSAGQNIMADTSDAVKGNPASDAAPATDAPPVKDAAL